MHDMHCHLGFMTNGEEVARDAFDAGTLIFANTVTPREWIAANTRFAKHSNVIVGFGMHPWWIDATPPPSVNADAESQGAPDAQASATSQEAPVTQAGAARLDTGRPLFPGDKSSEFSSPAPATVRRQALSQRAKQRMLLAQSVQFEHEDDRRARQQYEDVMQLLCEHEPRVIGEIGLDLGYRHAFSRDLQIRMFEGIARWAAKGGGRLLSIHSIKAAHETLDVLERTGALDACTCVFHWFTGPSNLLKRAIERGCYFSCGPRMLATGKGREYVKAIPENRLLLETDAPPAQDTRYSYAELRSELESAAQAIASIKGGGALETLAKTSTRLLQGS